jgi:hypothetical protein
VAARAAVAVADAEDVAANQSLKLKKSPLKRIIPYFITAVLYAIPFVITALQYKQLNPYSLSGRQFLVFFICHSLISYCCLIIWKKSNRRGLFLTQVIICCSMLIGLLRMAQGIENHKPVGYLMVLLVLNSIIYTIIWHRGWRPL